MLTRFTVADRTLLVDFAHPHSLAQMLEPGAPGWFGAPPAINVPLRAGTFVGAVAAGGSCNCNVLSLAPHCHGTHTECVGHLTLERVDAAEVAPQAFLPALLVTVPPERADESHESSDPAPHAADALITRRLLEAAWPTDLPFTPSALVLRTLPNPRSKTQPARAGAETRAGATVTPFFTREASQWLVERGIEHAVVDIPSLDRLEDGGLLTAHRIFFGLPAGSRSLAAATRPGCTLTELAYIDDSVRDGPYLLSLQLPALSGDAVPSRPVLYAARAL
jgi:kynurenine formamidase